MEKLFLIFFLLLFQPAIYAQQTWEVLRPGAEGDRYELRISERQRTSLGEELDSNGVELTAIVDKRTVDRIDSTLVAELEIAD